MFAAEAAFEYIEMNNRRTVFVKIVNIDIVLHSFFFLKFYSSNIASFLQKYT